MTTMPHDDRKKGAPMARRFKHTGMSGTREGSQKVILFCCRRASAGAARDTPTGRCGLRVNWPCVFHSYLGVSADISDALSLMLPLTLAFLKCPLRSAILTQRTAVLRPFAARNSTVSASFRNGLLALFAAVFLQSCPLDVKALQP